MAMPDLMREFLEEECDGPVREIIEKTLAEGRSNPVVEIRTLEFNRFYLTFFFHKETVLIEDVLDVEREQRTGLEAFVQALSKT